MDAELIRSLALITAGAAITFLVDYLRGISARRREWEDREEQRREVRRLEGRAHTEEVLRGLDAIWNTLTRANNAGGMQIPDDEASRIYSSYLLIPDAEIRALIQYAMYGANNFHALDEDAPTAEFLFGQGSKQREYIFAARSSVAAYLRGDKPEDEHVTVLRDVSFYLDARFGLD